MSFVKIEKRVIFSSEGKNIIAQDRWLEDMHMEHFYHLLKSCSDYRPVSTFNVIFLIQYYLCQKVKNIYRFYIVLILIYI